MLHDLQPHAQLIKRAILYYRHATEASRRVNTAKNSMLFMSYIQKMLDKENYHHLTRAELKYIITAVDWYAAAYPDPSLPLSEIQTILQELLKKRRRYALLHLPTQIPRRRRG